jgi:cyclophilin family peptidyl-prolyl cis-trans isomerase
MFPRALIATLLLLSLAASASAQVVRFETTMGNFDMVLNPTNNPRLQGHVNNLLQYVNNNSYNSSWINRADTGFVLQMGGFHAHTKRPPMTIDSTRPVDSFAPVAGSPMIPGLSNTVGTVSLALPANNINGGTSSFFVNIGNNAGLDNQFTVFGAIPDMGVVNQIMALTKIDRTTEPQFGAGPGNLAFTDVPIQANGFQVFIKRAFVVQDAMTIARDTAAVQSVVANSAATFANSVVAEDASSALTASAGIVPEPASSLLAFLAALGAGLATRRRRR